MEVTFIVIAQKGLRLCNGISVGQFATVALPRGARRLSYVRCEIVSLYQKAGNYIVP